MRDIGVLTPPKIVLDTFWFENIGNGPIQMTFVSCKQPFIAADWTREPIRSAHRGYVAFLVKTSKFTGPFYAELAIQSNAVSSQGDNLYKIYVKGVIGKDAAAAKKKKPTPKKP